MARRNLNINIKIEGNLTRNNLLDPDIVYMLALFLKEYTGKKFEVKELTIHESKINKQAK
jgi:hypothetical protein